ncbi:MAG: hypothetical protein V4456_10830 [Bacteroidota bacterium]
MRCCYIFVLFVLVPALLVTSCKQSAHPAKHSEPVPDISGVYKTSNGGDPQGGGFLYILPDHRFVIGFFGGALTGTWEINDTAVLFKPQVKPTGFKVYGRHNNRLGDNISILFEGFANSGMPAVGFEPLTKKVRRVFDDGSRNADFSRIGKFVGIPQGILLAAHKVDETGQIVADNVWRMYVYNNPDKYNDFIAKYIPENTRPKLQNFYGTIKAGKLDFDQKASDKKPFTNNDRIFTEQLLSIPVNPDKAFYSSYYIEAEPGFEKDTLRYRFNTRKNAYIKLRSYTEGEENNPHKQDGSNGLNIIYQYRQIKASVTSGQVNLNAKPIVTTKVMN